MKIYMDFAAILAIATVIAGLIWLVDVLFFKKKRLALNPDAKEPKLVEYARSFFPILLIVLILRAFIIEPYRIPSPSMKPTLLEGDFILVNKYGYGLRLPIWGTKFLPIGEPKRGDILVFRFPKDTSVNFIKRVVGLPGDRIRYQDKVLYINDKPVEQKYLGMQNDTHLSGNVYPEKLFEEQLPGKAHNIYIQPQSNLGQDMPEKVVPPGMFFVMGDNRDHSEDSRFWGFVPDDLILGKAFLIWLSWDPLAKDIRWQRIGQQINK